MEAAVSIAELLVIQSLSVSGQHNVGCGHEPKRVVTYKRNVDEYRNDCEQGDNKRNDMDTENVEHRNSRRHSLLPPENLRGSKVFSFVKNYKAKQMTDKIFAQ
jgi:hypothetical protein